MLGRSAWPVTHCVNQGGLKLASNPVTCLCFIRAGLEDSACLGVCMVFKLVLHLNFGIFFELACKVAVFLRMFFIILRLVDPFARLLVRVP